MLRDVTPVRRFYGGLFIGSRAVSERFLTKKQLRSGLFRRVLHNVYVDQATLDDHQLRARAAGLLMPSGTALTGRSAAGWYGAPFATLRDDVLVAAPRECAWSGPSGVRVHRCDLQQRDLRTTDDGVVLTTPVRTAWDIAIFESIGWAVAYLDAMVRAEHVTVEELTAEFTRRRGQWRSTRAERVLPLVDARAMSPPESRFRVEFALAGLPAPEIGYRVVENGAWLGDVDFAWPHHRVVVEYEGEYHFDAEQIRKDDNRYAALVAAGWTVIRLSNYDLRHMADVVEQVSTALGLPR